ncbi:MAG: T9SS type A sorting domain-containing protein [Candidatus Eisenbacteria bacterium]|nr:T9SS type A sorting domain-containing protein [Candidatus Eisenbacteria bacterium]
MKCILACAVALAALAVPAAAQWQQVEITENRILDFALEGSVVWLSANDTGLVRYDGTTVVHNTTTSGIRQDSWAYSLLVDSRGLKWLGRDGFRTVDVLDDAGTPGFLEDDAWSYFTYPDDFANRRVFSMTEDLDGNIWFGMRDEGGDWIGTLELYVPDADTVLHYDNAFEPFETQFSNDDVRALAVDDDGRLWIGYFAAGIDVWDYGDYATYEDDSWTHYDLGTGLPSNRIFELHVADDGRVLAGTQAGLVIFDDSGNGPTVIDDLPGSEVRSVATDARGYIWAGTDAGVAMLYPNGTTIRTFGVEDGLADPTVDRVDVHGASGTVWALTIGESIADTELHWFDSDISVPGQTMPVFPNPWRSDGTRRDVTVLGVAEGSEIRVYDITGERVRTLSTREEPYTWDTLDDDGYEVPGGLYILRVEGPDGATTFARVAIIR